MTIDSGDILGVSGANGSGKTTLLRLLATMMRPTSGSLETLGADAAKQSGDRLAARREIALIGHTPAIWDELTLRENVEILDGLSGGATDQDSLTLVGLAGAADRRGAQASLGMKRRVEFARVLRRVPRLLLLDEAHAGLDHGAREVVDAATQRVAAAGGAIVLVSHDADSIDHLVTRRATITGGTLTEAGA